MQLQSLLTFSSVALLANVAGVLADVGPSEIPQQCKQICQPVVHRSQHCDATTTDDRAEKQCMCNLSNASTIVPKCEACVAKFHGEVSDDKGNPHDNDVNDIIQFCNFTPTSFTGAGGGAGGGAVGPVTSSVSGMTSATSARHTPTRPVQTMPVATSSRRHTTASQSPTSPATPIFTGGAGVVNAGRNAVEALGVVFVAAALA